MARIRTLSRTFLKGHPSEGMPTFFIEKFLNSQKIDYKNDSYLQMLLGLNTHNLGMGKLSFEDIESFWISLQPIDWIKSHTIRAGKHFKQGDSISIRCWFGKPYKGCQIILFPDIQIKNTWGFIIKDFRFWIIQPNGRWENIGSTSDTMKKIALNDGLELNNLLEWFKYPKDFEGQIICWNKNIKY